MPENFDKTIALFVRDEKTGRPALLALIRHWRERGYALKDLEEAESDFGTSTMVRDLVTLS